MWKFNTRILIETYHSSIMDICSKIPGKKYLMIHEDVQVTLDKICCKELLDKCDITKIIALADYSVSPEIKRMICLLPSDYNAVQSIIKMIKSDKDKNIKRTLVLGFVPFLTESCRFLLEKEELPLENIGIFDLKIGWIPIDEDLLTFNAPYLFSSSFLHHNTSWCYFFGEMIADAMVLGLDRPTYTCQVYSLGETSDWCYKGFNDTCNRTSSNFKSSDSKTKSTNIFIFSRDIDYMTPFCLPITFEGMLHEVMNIEFGQVKFTKDITGEADKKEYMNSGNSVFQEIRALPLTMVVDVLSKRHKALTDKKNEVDVMKSPDQLSTFVKSEMKNVLLEQKQLTLCYSAYDHIIKETTIHDRVDDLMSAQASLLLASDDWEFPRNLIIEFLTCRYENKLFDALRLICLWTVTYDGLPQEVYQEMYRLICHSAGYPIIYLLQNLRKLKLFAPREDFVDRGDFTSYITGNQMNLNAPVPISSGIGTNIGQMKQLVMQYKSKYFYLRNTLKLFHKQQMNISKDCVHASFIFGGHHSPICSALIEMICQKKTDVYKEQQRAGVQPEPVTGKTKKVVQPIDEAFKNLNISAEAAATYGRKTLGSGSSVRSTQSSIDTIVVCFVGGCCYSEIAALRHMANLNKWNLLILTSCILNTKSLIFQVSSDD